MARWFSAPPGRREAEGSASSSTPRIAYIHVGIHKTGTSSIQEFLGKHRSELKRLGVEFYTGTLKANNHVDLMLATIRPERMTPYKMLIRDEVELDDAFRADVFASVSDFIRNSTAKVLLFSCEGLSFLAHEDELNSLKALFDAQGVTAKIILYTRNPKDFLASYAAELKKHPSPAVITRDSFAYVGQDSWLIDYPSRIAAFARVFGGRNVLHADYDEALRSDGTVITSFLKILGLESQFPATAYQDLWLNLTTKGTERAARRSRSWRSPGNLLIAFFPVLAMALFLALRLLQPAAYAGMIRQGGVVDSMQTLVFLASAAVALAICRMSFQYGNRRLLCIHAMLFVAIAAAGLEGLGWFERLPPMDGPPGSGAPSADTGPDLRVPFTAQWQWHTMSMALGLYGGLAWLAVHWSRSAKRRGALSYLVPTRRCALYFLSLFGACALLCSSSIWGNAAGGGPLCLRSILAWEPHEPAKLLLALGVLLFLLGNHRRARAYFIDGPGPGLGLALKRAAAGLFRYRPRP